MNFAMALSRAAVLWSDRAAVSRGETVVHTHAQLASRAGALAAWLAAQGVAPGDRIAVAMSNRPEYFEILYGIWHAGCCVVPVNTKLHQREIAYILENSGTRLCFADGAMPQTIAPLVDEVATLERVIDVDDGAYASIAASSIQAGLVPRTPTDPAWLFYTSGTTGRPKGATLTHRNLWMMVLTYHVDIDPLDAGDSMLHAAPISHASGLFSLALTAVGGNQVVPDSGHFDTSEVYSMIRRWPKSSIFLAPTMLVRLINDPAADDADLSNLKTITYGGGPMYVADLQRALDKLGPCLVQIYGQGESPCTITSLSREMHAASDHPRWLERLASAGVARSATEVMIADEDDRELPRGELGEILVRGDIVMAGYWDNPEATERTLRGGWLHTGDIGVMDDDGFVTLKDRSKDLIISGGSNIYPREVEEVLLQHADVLEVSVVSRPHADWIEEVVAFVVRRPDTSVSAEVLDRLCLDNLARFKRPRDYRFVESLPKNNYGKVLKTDLRQMLLAE